VSVCVWVVCVCVCVCVCECVCGVSVWCVCVSVCVCGVCGVSVCLCVCLCVWVCLWCECECVVCERVCVVCMVCVCVCGLCVWEREREREIMKWLNKYQIIFISGGSSKGAWFIYDRRSHNQLQELCNIDWTLPGRPVLKQSRNVARCVRVKHAFGKERQSNRMSERNILYYAERLCLWFHKLGEDIKG